MDTHRHQRGAGLLAACLLSCGAFLLGIWAAWPPVAQGMAVWRDPVPRGLVLAVGAACAVTALAWRRMRLELLLAAAAASGTFAIALCLVAWPQRETSVAAPVPTDIPVEYTVVNTGPDRETVSSSYRDQRNGFRFTPGSQWRDKCGEEFDITAVIDEEGWRRVPDVRPRVVLLGCSFTIGVGVADDQTYAAHLSRALDERYRVVNAAGAAWGTANAAVNCEDELAKPAPVAAVLYGFIAHHAVRNYLSESWHRTFGGGFPFFELNDGRLEYQGLRLHSDCHAPDDGRTVQKQTEITQALIQRMDEMCRDRGVRFFVVGLPEKILVANEVICEWLPATSVGFIDLRQAIGEQRDCFYPIDGHPNPKWHRQVGDALAASEQLKFLREPE